MDLPWGDEKTVQFVTNVGLITSDGQHGQNIVDSPGIEPGASCFGDLNAMQVSFR